MVREIREYGKCRFTNLKLFCLKRITGFVFFWQELMLASYSNDAHLAFVDQIESEAGWCPVNMLVIALLHFVYVHRYQIEILYTVCKCKHNT